MEHPILFNGEMVRAILDGRKTQTRRIIKPQPKGATRWTAYPWEIYHDNFGLRLAFYPDSYDAEPSILHCPYGEINDLLWVRESMRRYRRLNFLEQREYNTAPDYFNTSSYLGEDSVKKENQKWTAQYTATSTAVPYTKGAKEGWCGTALWQWKNKSLPSVFMPRWASRITLEITNIRVEKLQYISIDDIEKEGFYKFSGNPHDEGTYIHQFVNSWDYINAKRGYSWESNPWCWCIDFKRR